MEPAQPLDVTFHERAGTSTTEARVGDDRIHLLLLQQITAVAFQEVVGVSRQRGRAKLCLEDPSSLGRLKAVLNEGLQLITLELPCNRVGVDLVLGVRKGQRVVALDVP
jgi:hypothetical protein